MGKSGIAILCSIIGGLAAAVGIVVMFGWGVPMHGQGIHVDPSRSDYVDLLLMLITIFLGAIGLAVTVGALVIGVVALKTLREIKEEAAKEAKTAAANKISETMANELERNINAKLSDLLPTAVRGILVDGELAHGIFLEMAQRGELDDVLERVVVRVQEGGPEIDPDDPDQF